VARSAFAGLTGNTKPTQHVLRPVRGGGREAIAMSCGITVYPPTIDGQPWRAVFTENGRRRYSQATSESALAEKLAKVADRLVADADNMERGQALS
jgi:hypothetical protein